MTKSQVEVITSVQRRRRWPRAEKERIVAAALEPGGAAGRGCGREGRSRGTSVQKGFGRPEQSSSRSTRNRRPSVPGSSRAT
jgi:transposase